ncbi:MAG: EAL domain-containing response regulator [Oceanococcus sp.]
MDRLSEVEQRQLRNSRCLVVDDSAAIRGLLVSLLNDVGITQISQAENGLAALESLRNSAADIVLCDLYMPGMDGVELLRTIGAEKPGLAVLPISSLDARLRFAVSQMADDLGLNVLGVLAKPFTPKELIDALSSYVKDSSMDRDSSSGLSELELSNALDDRRVELLYQPQVRIMDGEIAGLEALVRLRDIQGKFITPNAFIELSESTGQIAQLTHMIVEAGLSQLGMWNRQGRNFTLSLNVSAATLGRLDLPEHIESIARSQGLVPARINIELTESQIKTGAELYDVMTRFRMRGFGLSLDDYGTGDSSLSRLRSMPFTELKLDQSFVRGCTSSDEQKKIVRSSIELAHDLGMQVVAEGVQTQAEWDLLEELGCDLAQGYLVGRPLEAKDVPRWARQWQRLCGQSGSDAA